MRKIIALCLLATCLLSGCGRAPSNISTLHTKWQQLKRLWGTDGDGMLASEGFYAPIEDEFIPLKEEDLQMHLAESVIPQPKQIPGTPGSGIPSLDQFRHALAHLADIFQNVYFQTDEHVLKNPTHLQIIERIASYLRKHPNTYIAIGGHCDERGSESYNLALGTRRANYVRSLLVQKGVPPHQMHAVSFGKEQPSKKGHDPSAWAKNRRADFRIHEK